MRIVGTEHEKVGAYADTGDRVPYEGPYGIGALLEKIEIMRSALRWPQNLDRTHIQKLFNQTNALREEVLRLSHTERFVQAKSQQTSKHKQNISERRQSLLDRTFQFDGVFGESRKLI